MTHYTLGSGELYFDNKLLGITAASDSVIPDRVSVESRSPYFWPEFSTLGVKIGGRERLGDVVEFCVSEGWAKVRAKGANGRPFDDGTGHWATEKVIDMIEPYIKKSPHLRDDNSHIRAAEAKRARKAAKLRKLADSRSASIPDGKVMFEGNPK